MLQSHGGGGVTSNYGAGVSYMLVPVQDKCLTSDYSAN